MKLKRKPDEYYLDLLEEIDNHGDGLSDWEINFIEDITQMCDELRGGRRALSEPQKIKLEEIYRRRVSST